MAIAYAHMEIRFANIGTVPGSAAHLRQGHEGTMVYVIQQVQSQNQ